MNNYKVISLFSGCGGLDLGFQKAGFNIIWANEYDKSIWKTHEYNFSNTFLDKRDIREINAKEIPDTIGIIGGPPCQSWSGIGNLKGINDPRGQLFFDYIRVIKEKQPHFFLAENVSGILHKRNERAFNQIISMFQDIGYHVHYKLLNSKDYNIPQDRKRVFIIGFKNKENFHFPEAQESFLSLREALSGLPEAKKYDKENLDPWNNEYYEGNYSSIFMSRNRVRNWDEVSYTIQAGGRHAPIHPQAPKMEKIGQDEMIFARGQENLYRRLSVRECARIQTFPDNFRFIYKDIMNGYKMVGNAVSVNLAHTLALEIRKYL